jgi:hypothetical protein
MPKPHSLAIEGDRISGQEIRNQNGTHALDIAILID